MATFTSDLADPNTRSASQSQRGVVDDSNAGFLKDIARGISSVGSGLAQSKADKEARAGNETLAGLQREIIEMDTERRAIAQDEETLRAKSIALHEGGITPDEQDALKELGRERERLLALRKTRGNTNAANTRINALFSSALANPDNVMIQGQINSLFQQGRSQASQEVEDPLVSEQRQRMDFKYGQGNWDLVKLGEQQAIDNQVATDTARGAAYLTANSQVVTSIIGNSVEPMLLGLARAVGDNGGIADPSALNATKTGIRNTMSQVRTRYLAGVAAQRQAGLIIDQTSVDAVLREAESLEQAYVTKLDNLGETPLDAIKKINEYNDQIIISRASVAPSTMQALLTKPDVLEAHLRSLRDPNVGRLMASNDPLGRSVGELQAEAENNLALIYTGKLSIQDTTRIPASQQAFFAKVAERNLVSGSSETDVIKQELVETANTLTGNIQDNQSKAFINSSVASSIRYVTQAKPERREKNKAVVQGTMVKTWSDLLRRSASIGNPIKVSSDGQGGFSISVPETDPGVTPAFGPRLGNRGAGANVRVVNEAIQEFITGVNKLDGMGIVDKGLIFSSEEERPTVAPTIDEVPLESLTQADFDAMSAEQKRTILKRAGIDLSTGS